MNNFWQDVSAILLEYYESFVLIFPRLIMAALILVFFFFSARYLHQFTRKRLIRRMYDVLLATFIARTAKVFYLIIGWMLVLNVMKLTAIAGRQAPKRYGQGIGNKYH